MEKLYPNTIHQVYEAEKSPEPSILSAIPTIICFLQPDYLRYGNSSGSGFILDNYGTVLTAYHVYEDRKKEWQETRNISLITNNGLLRNSGLVFLAGDKKKDYAILRTHKLAGRRGIPISKTPSLTYDSPYYMIGYPHDYRQFPYPFRCAVSIGQRKVQENLVPEREQLWCSTFCGFSGAPILDTEGTARAIAISASISFTDTDFADVLPLRALDIKDINQYTNLRRG